MVIKLTYIIAFAFLPPIVAGSTLPSPYPIVGDFVLYEGCVLKDEKCVHFQREQQILAYEKSVRLITILQHYREDGQGLQAKVRKLHENAFYTPVKFQELLDKCHGRDEQSEYSITHVDVPAGRFQACKQTSLSDGTEAYIADVPFGFVKVVSPKLRYELHSYRNGFGTP